MQRLLLFALATVAWAQPGDLDHSTEAAPAPPLLRGVSIEKPTQLAYDHKEYAWVDWAACKDIMAAHHQKVGDPNAKSHDFKTMKTPADGQQAGDRAACMAVAAMTRLPGLNVLRIPIEPGSWTSMEKRVPSTRPLGDDGVISRKSGELQTEYIEGLLVPILEAVRIENLSRQARGQEKIYVVLDWHYVAAGDGMGKGDTPWPWTSVEKQTQMFWKAIASAEYLKSYDNLIFEVFNEPVIGDDLAAWEAGLSAIVQDLHDRTDRPIVVGAPSWSGRGEVGLLNEVNADWRVQAEHCYTNKASCRGSNAKLPDKHVFATEVGADDDDLQDPITEATTRQDMEALLDQYQTGPAVANSALSGWVAWVFAPPKAHEPALLDKGRCNRMNPCRLDQVGWTEWGTVVHGRLGTPASPTAPSAAPPAP